MKTLIALFILSLSHIALADCYERLTQNYTRDSHAYQLSEDAVDYNLERGEVFFARAAVEALESKLGCQSQAAAKAADVANGHCSEVVPGVSTSRVCYVEKQYGYFLVSVDMLENINI